MTSSVPRPPHPSPRQAWSRFVGTFGWRAYAVVILAVLTVIVVVRPGSAAGSDATAARPPASNAPAPAPPAAAASGAASSAAASSSAATPPAADVPLAAPSVIPDKVDSTPCQSNSASQFVLVSISSQKAWMCQGSQQVNSTPVTTGNVKAGDATPLGSWRVQAKQTNRYLTGPGYSDFVKFWVPFNGDFGFHDASWQTFAFGSSLYQTAGSNGCVHLPTPAMTWFYSWVQDGATVTISA